MTAGADSRSGPFDLVVVGGGSAGIVGAKTAAGLGARVVLVERDRIGGDCLWRGCVPSKALLASARAAHAARSGARLGIVAAEPTVDFARVMGNVHDATSEIEPNDSPEALRAAGVTVVHGAARFTGPGELRAGDQRLRFRRALVATGSAPALPPVPGLSGVDPLTSDSVWELRELPERLLVLGGGPIGCELGQAFSRLGSEVTILEMADRLLPREEPAAGEVLAARLTAEGVNVRTGTAVTAVRGTPGAAVVDVRGPSGDGSLGGERILVAAGRTPTVDELGLETVGVHPDRCGYVPVDARLRSNNRRIYAAGDVTGGPAFTHVAGTAGSVAASNAVTAPLRRIDNERMPWVTFTDPEVGHVGLTEAQARQRHGDTVRTRVLEHAGLDRAITDGDTGGFTHVVLDRRGRVLGATVVAPRAAEMLTELTAAVARGARLRELASVVHPYPGWGDSVWNTAVAEWQDTLATPAARRVSGALLRLRRAAAARQWH